MSGGPGITRQRVTGWVAAPWVFGLVVVWLWQQARHLPLVVRLWRAL